VREDLAVILETFKERVYQKGVKTGIAKERETIPLTIPLKNGVPKESFSKWANNWKHWKPPKCGIHLAKARDLYMASFYLRGMNWDG